MSSDWIKSEAALTIINLLGARRPAWLWSSDGNSLIWRNKAARLFLAEEKKGRLKLAKDAVPIRGQVRRLLRLGSIGLASPARVQFLAGAKPISATCLCTPMRLDDDRPALLIVSNEKIKNKLRKKLNEKDAHPSTLFSPPIQHVFVGPNGGVLSGSEQALEEWGATKLADMELWTLALEATKEEFGVALKTGKKQSSSDTKITSENKNDEPIETAETLETNDVAQNQKGQLSHILDRLSNGSNLFAPLEPDEDETDSAEFGVIERDDKTSFVESPHGPDDDYVDVEAIDDLEKVDGGETQHQHSGDDPSVQWRVVGRGFTKGFEPAPHETPLRQDTSPGDKSLRDTSPKDIPETSASSNKGSDPSESELLWAQDEDVERIARHNFDELGRILGDRIEHDGKKQIHNAQVSGKSATGSQPGARTLRLSDELLILNRLPIGILIFRDQSILFANRALADIMGSSSISKLRDGGLEAIFPRVDSKNATLGPVANILDLDGAQIPVTARLQSILWQGGSALMLSAQKREPSVEIEKSVQDFVRTDAALKNEGYFEADNAGILLSASQIALILFDRDKDRLIGKPLLQLVETSDQAEVKSFMDEPSKSAETDRPCLSVLGIKGETELRLFTKGRAGIVTGYFGTVAKKHLTSEVEQRASDGKGDNGLLVRLSRGIRGPLNTIVGFSDLAHSEASKNTQNQRLVEYARDIKTAGGEITRLVDEVDELLGLEEAGHPAQTEDFDLTELLDECLRLVRREASRRQVFVRSAISTSLFKISADRATMRQALLNLLASAIDQSRAGGKVILSAQKEPDGSIDVHVRSSYGRDDVGERFVVFRERDDARPETIVPMKSSMGLALTRSLLAVNDCSLSIAPSGGTGTLVTLLIPAGHSVKRK